MNIRELEALFIELIHYDDIAGVLSSTHREKVIQAMRWCRSQQEATATRKALFKHRADEQRELLR